MKKLIPAGFLAAMILVPTTAWAQLPVDVTASPTKDTGGWVYNMAQLMAVLGVLMVVLVVAGFLRWAPRWAETSRKKAAAGPPSKPAAPPLAPRVAVPSFAVAAAEASAASIGEKAHTPQAGAVPVVENPTSVEVPTADEGHAAEPRAGTADVYETTLRELVDKGVPQKVAEARAKMAAKKAGG